MKDMEANKHRINYLRKYWYNIVDWIIFIIAKPFYRRNVRQLIKEFNNNPLFIWPKMKDELGWDIPEYMKHVKSFWWINSSHRLELKYFWQNSRMYTKAKGPILTAVYAYVLTKITVKDYYKYHHTTNCNMTINQHEEWWKKKGKEMEDFHARHYDWNKYKHLMLTGTEI